MNPNSIYAHSIVRVAACTNRVYLGDLRKTADEIVGQLDALDGVAVAVFPELSLTGVTQADLYRTDVLNDQVEYSLEKVVAASKTAMPIFAVGAPLRFNGNLYNCAVVIHRGEILGVITKQLLDERDLGRFTPGSGEQMIRLCGQDVPVRAGSATFTCTDIEHLTVEFTFTNELRSTLASGNIVAVLDGSPALVGDRHNEFFTAYSELQNCAVMVASPGLGESSTDFSLAGARLFVENGQLLNSSQPFTTGSLLTDFDLGAIAALRRNRNPNQPASLANFRIDPPTDDLGTLRQVPRFPFLPIRADEIIATCKQAFQIQVNGLIQRLSAIGNPKIVLGISGGLDSTMALLVAAQAMDQTERDRSEILTFTMPGFATTEHTKSNAEKLSEALGATFETLDIRPSAELMLNTIGHSLDQYDVTYENVQAGLRADYLFRIANQRGGIVLGTGDMSELSLGWCTYGVGDQMSHYDVNSGIPKTMMQFLIRSIIAENIFGSEVSGILQVILDTEITPELIPTVGDAKPQATEDSIGPYNLHDFTLYWLLRYGFGPAKIAYLAQIAWGEKDADDWPELLPEKDRVSYSRDEILHWLEVFGRRFYSQQFKRSASPDGPAVLWYGSLSPRSGWQMPSDTNAALWQAEIDQLRDEYLILDEDSDDY